MKNKSYLRPKNNFRRVEEAKFESYKKSCNRVTNICALAILNDVFDFSNEDLQKFQDWFQKLMSSVYHDQDNLDNLEKALKEEFGIELEEV